MQTADKQLKDEKWQKMPFSGSSNEDEDESFFERTFKTLYGNLPKTERLRVFWLALTLFFIIGGYWLLRSLKDPIVSAILGVEYIPKCKMLSLVVVFGLVFIYNKLIDIFPKHQLFYIVGGFYTVTFSVIAYYLADPVIGIENTKADPYRLLGWISYCAIESFGSIGVSLFWAFVNATIDFEGAKSAYGLIVAGAQIGSILGPSIATQAPTIGVPKLYAFGSVCMGMMVLMMYIYTEKFGVLQEETKSGKKKESPGVMEGFYLFLKYNYIKGIFAISCLFMVEVTILDYTMKVLAKDEFDTKYPDDPSASIREFASFMGKFGQVTNGLSFMFSLMGTSYVIRTFGLRKTLLAFPTMCLLAILTVYFAPNLWVVFSMMMFMKGFSYALNNPTKEILYQPTSTAVKFKSKSWIDIFGARGAKAMGSVVTNAFASNATDLVNYGSLASVLMSVFLMWNAVFMGTKFDEYMESGHIVGETLPLETEMTRVGKDKVHNSGDDDDASCGLLEPS